MAWDGLWLGLPDKTLLFQPNLSGNSSSNPLFGQVYVTSAQGTYGIYSSMGRICGGDVSN